MIIILIPFTLLGCWNIYGYDYNTIVLEYNIGWSDYNKYQSIYKASDPGEHGGEPIIDEYVYAVGHNDSYIIAKQHPPANDSINSDTDSQYIDVNINNYYIVDISIHPYRDQKGIYGPLSKSAFDSMRQKLKINEIKFDMIYPENP